MKFYFDIFIIVIKGLFLSFLLVCLITYPLGFFGYDDQKINKKICVRNLLYLPYLFGFNKYLLRTSYKPLPSGIYVFTGKQGSGKTLSLVYTAYDLMRLYDYSYKYSNMQLQGFANFRKFDELLGLKRCLCVADELGIVANSKKSKDFNEDLLRITAQNRKNQRLILTTAQQYYQVAKDIRTQAKYIIDCSKIGCLVINRYYIPFIDEDGNITKNKPKKIRFFLATKKLYSLYDTSEVIL